MARLGATVYYLYITISTYYDTLGLQRTASGDDIKKAYRSLQLKHHPEKTKSLEETKREKSETISRQLNVAYETLADPASRRKYDATLPTLFQLPIPTPTNTMFTQKAKKDDANTNKTEDSPFWRTPPSAHKSHGPSAFWPKEPFASTSRTPFTHSPDTPSKMKKGFSVFEDTPPKPQPRKARGFTIFSDDTPAPNETPSTAEETPPASPQTPRSPLGSKSPSTRTPFGPRTPATPEVQTAPQTPGTPGTPCTTSAREDSIRRRLFNNVSIISGEGLGWTYTIVLNGAYALFDHPRSTVTTEGQESIVVRMRLRGQTPTSHPDFHVTVRQEKGCRGVDKLQSLLVMRGLPLGGKAKALEITLAACPLDLVTDSAVLDLDKTLKFGWNFTMAGVGEAPKELATRGTCNTLWHNEEAAKIVEDSARGPICGQRPSAVLERELLKEEIEKQPSGAVVRDLASEEEGFIESGGVSMFCRAAAAYVDNVGGYPKRKDELEDFWTRMEGLSLG